MINLDSGTLYISNPDGSQSILGEINEMKLTVEEENDMPCYIRNMTGLEASFKCLTRFTEELTMRLTGLYDIILDCSPNKRVVYLAKHHKKKRIRKKNFHRAIKFLEDLK